MSDKKMPGHFGFGKKRLLTFCGSSFASLGLLMLFISLSTDFWITTFERMSHLNITTIIAQNSGLWRKCWLSYDIPGATKVTHWSDSMKTFPSQLVKNCSIISYFKEKPKNSGEMKAPEAILYEMRTSAIFSVISFIVLLIGSILSLLSFCDEKLKKSIFLASGLYVLSGIFLLIGIVLYVGCISQAFDSKSDNTDSENIYQYDYGISFYFSVAAFILSEFAGVFSIYLYIAKQKQLRKIINTSELFQSNSDDKIVKTPNLNHIGLNNIFNNTSEISPVSNISQPSYQPYRRYSEQVLLKLYPNMENVSQYSSPTRNSYMLNKPLTEEKWKKESFSFVPEFRASRPSPIINYLGKRESKENMYEPSSLVIFYNDSRLESSPNKENPMVDSLILNQTTYFDSPISESLKENSKSLCPSNICNTCNLSFNLCNCACALLFLDKSNMKEQKIYSTINNNFPLPSAIYNNHNNSIINNNNNNNNNVENNHSSKKSGEFENLIQVNSNTLSKVGKQRKITAV